MHKMEEELLGHGASGEDRAGVITDRAGRQLYNIWLQIGEDK